ncbi:uncharacterized protein LOC103931309 [Pyrus x bretschneideri]|uniref:uncharacterized protein LOC103931309 n=1 Tax=Pyrus x bretschneideri TaxID=225117 RepID=UPI0005116701|nr:uncharacterized protein LOC103931309 [Pyrus x bretschneideri]
MVFSSSTGLYEYDHDASKATELEVSMRIKVIIRKKFSEVVTVETNIQNTVDKSLQANPSGNGNHILCLSAYLLFNMERNLICISELVLFLMSNYREMVLEIVFWN